MSKEKIIVNSWNEWDPLKHVIVGKADGTCIPAPEPALDAKVPEDSDMRGQFGPRTKDSVDKANQLLDDFANILKKKGRLAVISFHSLEDRIVKNFFNKHSGKIYNKSRYLPQSEPNNTIRKSLKIITKKVIKPMKEEIELNYYSRSAKLRVIEKI